MDERIKKLWEQATFDESRIVDGVYHPYIALQFAGEPVRYSITDEQKAKFAKLIIQECISICEDMDGVDNFEQMMHPRTPRYDCAIEIREHFGVK